MLLRVHFLIMSLRKMNRCLEVFLLSFVAYHIINQNTSAHIDNMYSNLQSLYGNTTTSQNETKSSTETATNDINTNDKTPTTVAKRNNITTTATASPTNNNSKPVVTGERNIKYVSFSLFSKDGISQPPLHNIAGIFHNAALMPIIYPEWKMLLYVPKNTRPEFVQLLRDVNIVVKFEDFDAKTWMIGMFWRFYAGDLDDCERFLVRDLDSRVTWRERRAVDEWIKAGTLFHTMRDHKQHTVPILGGMWGAVGGLSYMLFNKSFHDMAQEQHIKKRTHGDDQHFLTRCVWPKVLRNATIHDSRSGEWPGGNQDMVPYRQKRKPYFVGEAFQDNYSKMCAPQSCINTTYNCALEDGRTIKDQCVWIERNFRKSYEIVAKKKFNESILQYESIFK